jgi:cyclopropane fatty-acyl-phospholipid synthase-like methyltransferase
MSDPRDPRDPRDVVARGYDAIAERYLEWSALRPSEARIAALAAACDLIPAGSRVLELGCGGGVPMTRALADGRDVTGVDISATQVELARRNVPSATFLHADMTAVSFPRASFDAVVAFYSLTHVPRDDVPPLLGRIREWLRPRGVFIASMGVEDDPGGVEPDWLGVEMYFSQFSARTNRRLVEEAGLVVDAADVRSEPEDRFDARFLWVVAHAP